MQEDLESENKKLDHIQESLDLLFTRITDIGVAQQLMRKQIESNTKAMEQQAADQKFMQK
jgi:hypothetical protein